MVGWLLFLASEVLFFHAPCMHCPSGKPASAGQGIACTKREILLELRQIDCWYSDIDEYISFLVGVEFLMFDNARSVIGSDTWNIHIVH